MRDPRDDFRTETPPNLHGKHVLLVGCGSVGGFLAWQAASAGFTQLTLVDRDSLEAKNLRRHCCGQGDIGRHKVNALADFLQERFPLLQLEQVVLDVLESPHELRGLLATAALVLVAVDAEGPKHLLDAMAREMGIPTLYVGIYGGGWAGEIILSEATTPCYACSARTFGRVGIKLEAAAFPADYDLPDLKRTASEWLHADLTSIIPLGALAVRLASAILAQTTHPHLRTEFGESSAWRFAFRHVAAWELPPWCLQPVAVSRTNNCPNCTGLSQTTTLHHLLEK